MPQSLTNVLVHFIFSTKNRQALIDADLGEQPHAYLAGICKEMGGKPIKINGAADHVHILTYVPSTVSTSEAVRVIKSNSSRWVHTTYSRRGSFAWQSGYAAFSVSQSHLEAVRDYIVGQEERHKTVSFQDEYREFLRRSGIAFDERYVWD